MVDAERRAQGGDVPQRNRHLVFSGDPGTGKTTMAEEIGQLYNALGLLPTDKFHKVSGAELIDRYQNGTPRRVREEFDKAKGGVLFIDEAYGMKTGSQNEAGQQAVDTLVNLIQAKNNDTVVILAGYPQQIDELFAMNSGMDRRFPTTINFEPFDHEERVQIMGRAMKRAGMGFKADSGVREALMDAVLDTGSGNAGDVENLWDKIAQAHTNRVASELGGLDEKARREALRYVTLDDVRNGQRAFVESARVAAPIRGYLVPKKRAS